MQDPMNYAAVNVSLGIVDSLLGKFLWTGKTLSYVNSFLWIRRGLNMLNCIKSIGNFDFIAGEIYEATVDDKNCLRLSVKHPGAFVEYR